MRLSRMGKYTYKLNDPDSGAAMEVILQTENKPTPEIFDTLVSQLKARYEELGGDAEEEEVAPDADLESMPQNKFEVEMAKRAKLKRMKMLRSWGPAKRKDEAV